MSPPSTSLAFSMGLLLALAVFPAPGAAAEPAPEAAGEWERHVPTRPGVGADEGAAEPGEGDEAMLLADEVSRVP